MSLAHEAIDIFDDLLFDKQMVIPCDDLDEEMERHEDENEATIYGAEYGHLLDEIERLYYDDLLTIRSIIHRAYLEKRMNLFFSMKEEDLKLCIDILDRFIGAYDVFEDQTITGEEEDDE